jgi:uncharacterized protein (DUF1800 family)
MRKASKRPCKAKQPKFARSRREFLGTGVAGTAALACSASFEAVANPPHKFAGLAPMRPAPQGVSAPLTPPPLPVMVMNKAAFGPRPGDVEAFEALGADDVSRLAAWVDVQLNPTGSDPEIDSRLADLALSAEPADQAAFDTIDKTLVQLWTEHSLSDEYSIRNRPRWQVERLTILRAMYSQWQLREVMSDFWFNHFNVFGNEFPTYGMLPNYESAIRPHIFGNFADMLKATAKTPTMLYYLDNYANTWPNPNENYAREVLELHTLGAIRNYYGPVDPGTLPDNSKGQRTGYAEIDVFELAKALTGWGVSDTTDGSPDTGEFVFRPIRHYNFSEGPIEVMDVTIEGPGGGESDATQILDYLAGHYGTAEYIAWKLCTRLIGEFGDISSGPLPAIISSTADEFYNRRNDADQLKEVCRHILTSSEFQSTWGEKVKRPMETVVRAMRAADVDLTFRMDHSTSNAIYGRLDDSGHYPFGHAPPTGYPDERQFWQGSGPLVTSWRTITYLLQRFDIVNLAQQTNAMITDPAQRTPRNVVNQWMNRMLGYALPLSNQGKIQEFIGVVAGIGLTDPLDNSSLVNTSDTSQYSQYQRIIRAAVALILMSPDAMRR